jgi:hypothetical protein
MTNPCSSEILIAPSVRCRAGKDRRDGPAAFHDPFPPEMRQPVAALNRAARCLAFRFHQINYTDYSDGLRPPESEVSRKIVGGHRPPLQHKYRAARAK